MYRLKKNLFSFNLIKSYLLVSFLFFSNLSYSQIFSHYKSVYDTTVIDIDSITLIANNNPKKYCLIFVDFCDSSSLVTNNNLLSQINTSKCVVFFYNIIKSKTSSTNDLIRPMNINSQNELNSNQPNAIAKNGTCIFTKSVFYKYNRTIRELNGDIPLFIIRISDSSKLREIGA